jgi:hypothetical protein
LYRHRIRGIRIGAKRPPLPKPYLQHALVETPGWRSAKLFEPLDLNYLNKLCELGCQVANSENE